ncbi:MAG: hypothetical protein JWN95_1505 [Frankiales bacterium]|nr:hypothetical protein [Frankiales bacterium]
MGWTEGGTEAVQGRFRRRLFAAEIAVLLLVLLCACGGNPAIPVPVITVSAAGSSTAKPGMALTVLERRSGCGKAPYQTYVAWRVSGPQPPPVTVRVMAPDGVEFVEASTATGSALTGPWVRAGLKFFLTNGDGAVLASASAPDDRC